MYYYFLYYLIFISVIAVVITVSDKILSVCHKKRVSENMLMTISLLGGSIAMFLTMIVIRHKTRHKKFMFGIPLMVIIQLSLFAYLWEILWG